MRRRVPAPLAPSNSVAESPSYAALLAKRDELATLLAEAAPPNSYTLYPLQHEVILDGGDYAMRDVGKLAAQFLGLAVLPILLALGRDDFAAHSAPRAGFLGALQRLASGRPHTGAQLQAWLATPQAWVLIAAALLCVSVSLAALRNLRPRAGRVGRVARVIAKAAVFYSAVWLIAGKQVAAVAVLRQAYILSPVTALTAGRTLRRMLSALLFMCWVCDSVWHDSSNWFVQTLIGYYKIVSAALFGSGAFGSAWVWDFARMYIVTNSVGSFFSAPLSFAGAAISLSAAAAVAYAVCSTVLPDEGIAGVPLSMLDVPKSWAFAGLIDKQAAKLSSTFSFFAGQARTVGLRDRGAALLANVARLDKLLSVAFVTSRYRGDTAVKAVTEAIQVVFMAICSLLLGGAFLAAEFSWLGYPCLFWAALCFIASIYTLFQPCLVVSWDIL